MAKLIQQPQLDLQVIFIINEDEARALDALAGYGDDAFIKAFYTHLGQSYMRDHEKGLRSFLKSIREMLPGYLNRADDARKVYSGTHRATRIERKPVLVQS